MSPVVRCVALLAALCLAPTAWSGPPGGSTVQIGTHARVLLSQPVTRVSVADPAIVDVQILNARELLVLGRRVGATNLILWLADGTVEDRLWTVHRDLTLLNSVLRDIHPEVRAESAPHRDAVVLRGRVPNFRFSRAAEEAARSFLAGGTSRSNRGVVVQAPDGSAVEPDAGTDGEAAPEATLRSGGDRRVVTTTGVRVLNLIRVEELPQTLEERLLSAIRPVGGEDVRVRRIARGVAPDDREDSFVFEGEVQNQVALVRVLTTAAQVLRGGATTADIRSLADEAGSLRTGRGGSGGGSRGSSGGGGSTSIASVISTAGTRAGGSGGGRSNVRSNPARAPMLSAAGGRILSFLEVRDLPQVRIEARLWEVNRTRLRTWEPNINLLLGDFSQGDILPSPLAALSQGGEAASIGSDGATVQNVLGLLGGVFLNTFQVQAGMMALDTFFALLEEEGIARSLATPSITVLSGESADINVGGQVPISTTIETDTSASSGTLFSSTVFADFGVSLNVVPRVGEDDFVTLDVAPRISFPNFTLTAAISESTGTTQSTTAFQSRSMSTSTRLLDGHALVLAGLLQKSVSEDGRFTPWLHKVPGFGWLARTENRQNDDLELVIVVSPNIVRDPVTQVALWEFATASELLRENAQPAPVPGPALP